MNTHADKTQENKSKTVAKETSQIQRGVESSFQLVDNRAEVIVQRKLQKKANNSPLVWQLKAIKDMTNNSPKVKQAAQLQDVAKNHSVYHQLCIQKKENNTGLPDNLKTGMENLSGHSMDDVIVHYNSVKPAQLQAHAYAQGTEIHLGSGQEKHLPHEAWHVVQQKQGRVKPTMQMKGNMNVNDDVGLEKEADVMGAMALQLKSINKDRTMTTDFEEGKDNRLIFSNISRNVKATVQRLTIDIGMGENSDGLVVVNNIRVEGRAPTSGSGVGQGDHTVSSALINLGIAAKLFGRQPGEAFSNLVDLFKELKSTVYADEAEVSASKMVNEKGDLDGFLLPRTLSGRKKESFTIDSVISEMKDFGKYEFVGLTSYEQIPMLKTWIEKYIRLANQRDNTSFSRSDERTSGGGQEGPAKDRLIELRNDLLKDKLKPKSDKALKMYINALLTMVDISPKPDELPKFMHRLLVHGHQVIEDYKPEKYLVIAMWKEIVRNILNKKNETGQHLLIAASKYVKVFFGIEAKL